MRPGAARYNVKTSNKKLRRQLLSDKQLKVLLTTETKVLVFEKIILYKLVGWFLRILIIIKLIGSENKLVD
jgi:hypothetical protein